MIHESIDPSLDQPQESVTELLARSTGATIEPIHPDFMLVVPDARGVSPMEEFQAESLGGRYIATRSDSAIANQHSVLLEKGLPVMSSIYTPDGLMLMHVPEGTRPVAGFMNSMHRQPGSYCGVFEEMGIACADLVRNNLGNPEPTDEYPILTQFALAADDAAPSGGRVIMSPPYILSERDREAVLADVAEELTALKTVTPDQAIYLVNCMDEGWTNEELDYEV